MAPPLIAALPEGLLLDAGYTITLDAVDPTTGAPVTGVIVSAGTVTGDEQAGGLTLLPETGPYMLVPGPGA